MSEKMSYNIDWIIPTLRNPTKLWNLASTITVAAVGILTKIIIGVKSDGGSYEKITWLTGWLNKTKIYNRHNITLALDNRPRNVPLITVSNHHSCFDDPGLWGTLKLRHVLRPSVMRWSLAAHNICFTCPQHAYFFMYGKCVPVVRGAGVYQSAVDFCIEQLAKGSWVHVFPEGKVNMTKENMRLKWGIGRMIFESPITPIVVPIWHIGMDDVLPNEPPYVLRFRKNLTFNFGEPIDFSEMLKALRERNATDVEARKEITDRIQTELLKLKDETERLHQKNFKAKS